MLKLKRTIFPFLILSLIVLTLEACKKNKVADIDDELYDLSKETSGFTWYKNSSSFLNKSSGSGHSQPLLRTRYNAVAATMLDASGKVMEGISFPEGSLIVKELNENSSTLERYAILYKKADSEYADANGWIWGYLEEDGKVILPASDKGSSCISCHSQTGNIDYMLMNKYFP
jgi:hypothetical protein